MAALAEKFGLLPYRAGSLLLVASATALGSGVAEAAQIIDFEIDQAIAAGPLPQYYLGLAGEVLLAAGRSAEGLALLDRAIAAIDEPGVGFYLPEIYRLRGERLLALGRGNVDEKARQAFAARATSPFGKARSSSSAAPKHPLARLRIFGLSDSGNAAVG